MKQINVFLAYCILLLSPFLIQFIYTKEHNCSDKDIDKLDEISARFLSLGKHQRKFPEINSQINGYCRTLKNDLSDLGKLIGTCLTGTAKQFGSIILYSYKTTLKQYCSPRAKKRMENMLVMAKCINRNEKAGSACLDKYIEALQRGKRAEPNTIRIGYACCDYFKFLTCLETVTKTDCTQKETDKIQDFVRTVFTGIVDVACGEYTESSDKCDRLPIPPKKQKSDKSYRTYFLPLVELWHSL